jgi:hypothetical protein
MGTGASNSPISIGDILHDYGIWRLIWTNVDRAAGRKNVFAGKIRHELEARITEKAGKGQHHEKEYLVFREV